MQACFHEVFVCARRTGYSVFSSRFDEECQSDKRGTACVRATPVYPLCLKFKAPTPPLMYVLYVWPNLAAN